MNIEACRFFAEKYDLKLHNTIICGEMNGYPVVVGVDPDRLLLNIGAVFKEEVGRRGMQEMLAAEEFRERYGISYARLTDQMIQADFPDDENIIAKMECVLLWVVSHLYVFIGVPNHCLEEMAVRPPLTEVDQQIYIPKKGEVLCSELVAKQKEMTPEEFREYEYQVLYNKKSMHPEKEGNYLLGALGAFLGAVVGAVPWAIAGTFGWFVGWLGYLIALAATKGYDLLKGRQGKGRPGIIIAASVVGAILGTLASEGIYVGRYILKGTLAGSLADIPAYVLYLFLYNGEYRRGLLVNLFLGLLFIFLGSRGVIREIRNGKR